MDRFDLARLLGATPRETAPTSEIVVVDQRDPDQFIAEFAVACGSGGLVFLADPGWGEAQRKKFHEIIHGPPVLGKDGRGWLMIPSGGSSGGLKFSRHDEGTILAAVKGFCAHFSISQVNAVGLLPLWHVSGFMAWMRSVITGGGYVSTEWKEIEHGVYPIPASDGACLSLVPTQLQRLLENAAAVKWLKLFSLVFVGGGPSWAELDDKAVEAGVPVSLSYGMTETLAMVAALMPTDFLQGLRSSGRPLSHVSSDLTDAGRVRITGESVHWGYYPEFSPSRSFTTDDLGQFDVDGRLTLLGRRDALIISGGKKVDPVLVESVLRESGEFRDLAVIGVPDKEWGQRVVVCYPASQDGPDESILKPYFARLGSHERPKQMHAIAPWPRNAQGKLNRTELMRSLEAIKS